MLGSLIIIVAHPSGEVKTEKMTLDSDVAQNTNILSVKQESLTHMTSKKLSEKIFFIFII
jgi:hypothetical protein